jgi:sugar/nucleoside kinase (ribokinase family)/D-arabinose 5-phosphate isomerase GutQ
MSDAKLDVIGCGSMVADLIYRTPRLLRADEKILLHPYRDGDGGAERRLVGGVVLNHLGWARVLGLATGIFGKMADDRHGAFLRQGMERLGIQHHLTLDGAESSFAAVFVDPSGNRAIYMSRGATANFKPDEIRRRHGSFIQRARLISTEISQLPLKTVNALLLYARAHSIPTVLDVDVPPSDACASLGSAGEFERALKLATILKLTKVTRRELVGGNDRDTLKMAQALRARYGSEAVVITDGARGCAIAAEKTALRVPAFPIKPVDTTGAGDAFLGAMLAGLRWELPWPAIGRLANAAAAVCCKQLGGFPAGFEARDLISKLYGADLPAPAPLASNRVHKRTTTGELPDDEVERFFKLCLVELTALRRQLDLRALQRAVEMIRAAEARGGRVHVTGVGKPEHVARYVASLLCSVGTPATFLHATETLHGSLGQVHRDDVVIAVSNSGNTAELCTATAAIKEHGAQLIAVTGNRSSELARMADLVLHAPIEREGGLLGLAPRISVLGEIYVLAGLSVALEAARGLTLEEYSRWHRAGSLGQAARKLANNGSHRARSKTR